jgi:hypothetical protein
LSRPTSCTDFEEPQVLALPFEDLSFSPYYLLLLSLKISQKLNTYGLSFETCEVYGTWEKSSRVCLDRVHPLDKLHPLDNYGL